MENSPAHLIIHHLLKHAPFDGWSEKALVQATKDAGYQEVDHFRFFPGGPIEALNQWIEEADTEMERFAHAQNVMALKTTERITSLIQHRLDYYLPHREAVRRALAAYTVPWQANHGVRTLYRTVDLMWQLAGDKAVDYNWYTKRMLLAAVYSSTLLYWLDDESENQTATKAFLERRLRNVMQVGKVMSPFKPKR